MAKNDRLNESLRKTRGGMFSRITKALSGKKIDEGIYDDLLDQLILADVGYDTSMYLVTELEARTKRDFARTGDDVLRILRTLIAEQLRADRPMDLSSTPAVILVIGVNGVGKTTSIGKLARYYKAAGKKVLLAAGDTFRAAASSQLDEWAARAGVDIVQKGEGTDPSAVIFEAVTKGKNEGYDLVICDTAGRLHNKKNLMNELGKIRRVVSKADEDARVETLLVLEAVTGQNAINQAREFIDAAGATGIILTKLDGTAKGGSVISIKRSLNIPVRFIGVGEKIDDIMEFDADAFARALVTLDED